MQEGTAGSQPAADLGAPTHLAENGDHKISQQFMVP